MEKLFVNLYPAHAADLICEHINRSAVSTECVASYSNRSQDGKEVIMLIFEKYYMRNSSRASLSVIIENINGMTAVFSAGSGGGQSALYKFDWGASENFQALVREAVQNHLIYPNTNQV